MTLVFMIQIGFWSVRALVQSVVLHDVEKAQYYMLWAILSALGGLLMKESESSQAPLKKSDLDPLRRALDEMRDRR